MARALIIVLDSVGIGGAPDAEAYGDAGSDTLGHIAEACAAGRGDRAGLRAGPLRLPHLAALGLGLAAAGASGRIPPYLAPEGPPGGAYGHAVETAAGKDTPSGHWEIAGLPLPEPWGHFPDTAPAFPTDLVQTLIAEGGLPGILGDRHAPGVAIIDELGAEHLRTGRPICYTSADSVFQIAAHEDDFGLEQLYDLCRVARRLCDPYRVCRVIARPFVGSPETGFRRTGNRKDFAVEPPGRTLLDQAEAAGRAVVSVGKIGDIFAHRATGREIKPGPNAACLKAGLEALQDLPDGGLIFVNLVDFDTEHGHRRDVPGYAAELEAFDARVPEILAALRPGDLAVITADHGNDPTWTGTDHTREQVPVLAFGPGIAGRAIGRRDSFADIGATVAGHLGLPWDGAGRPFLKEGQHAG
ncbi:phosphopentomutase [Methylobacterium mesophilicum SR1.6/6]|uniref:Phosphopentomutase n=1 Tax=Methylobacterium mesophilicum SR1.6/6 TaxID=908290 RepID=A0A6B9FTK0_9HYPH|nr:phosphopentomutase [Methylobacterium mesophilicum]QGY04255.1 phosphopentomutase [Methylobacterium mesophilicum SR1.6/6]